MAQTRQTLHAIARSTAGQVMLLVCRFSFDGDALGGESA